jgi:hypothetical protein
LCPLVPVELVLNAHIDGLGVALMVGALIAAERGRRAGAGALLGLATAVKLLPILLLPVLRQRRALFAFACAIALCALPYLGARDRLAGSLGEYTRRWRANDGAFALIHAAVEVAVRPTPLVHPVRPGPRLARLLTGRDRDEVYPDEAVNLLARLLAFGGCLTAIALAMKAQRPALVLVEVALGGFLLLSPTLHPWYVLWVLPLVALGAQPAWLALAALAPLGYLPIAEWRETGAWHEPGWTRLIEHGLCWGWLGARALRHLSLTRREAPVT